MASLFGIVSLHVFCESIQILESWLQIVKISLEINPRNKMKSKNQQKLVQ
jgi:hypothetical protein